MPEMQSHYPCGASHILSSNKTESSPFICGNGRQFFTQAEARRRRESFVLHVQAKQDAELTPVQNLFGSLSAMRELAFVRRRGLGCDRFIFGFQSTKEVCERLGAKGSFLFF